jgi:hypothetical protein
MSDDGNKESRAERFARSVSTLYAPSLGGAAAAVNTQTRIGTPPHAVDWRDAVYVCPETAALRRAELLKLWDRAESLELMFYEAEATWIEARRKHNATGEAGEVAEGLSRREMASADRDLSSVYFEYLDAVEQLLAARSGK